MKWFRYFTDHASCPVSFHSSPPSLPHLLPSQSSSISPQLTKLHQLAMQQSPFPMGPNNPGFQGTRDLTIQSFVEIKFKVSVNHYTQNWCVRTKMRPAVGFTQIFDALLFFFLMNGGNMPWKSNVLPVRPSLVVHPDRNKLLDEGFTWCF